MRAIVAETTVPRYLWTTAAQRRRPDAGWRRGGLLRLVDDAAEPALPGPDWVRLTSELAGVCGSDVPPGPPRPAGRRPPQGRGTAG